MHANEKLNGAPSMKARVAALLAAVAVVALVALAGVQSTTSTTTEAYAASSTTASNSETPVALVYELQPAAITISIYTLSYGTITPDFIYVFEATETSTTAAQSFYADWVAEYVVSFDTSGADATQLTTWKNNGSNIILAGQYEVYSSYWYPICLSSVTDGTEYQIMQTVFSSLGSSYSGVDYLELCGTVKTFKCTAVQSVTSNNADSTLLNVFESLTGGFEASSYYVPDGTVMTVELRLYESYSKSSGASGNYVTIGSYSYTF